MNSKKADSKSIENKISSIPVWQDFRICCFCHSNNNDEEYDNESESDDMKNIGTINNIDEKIDEKNDEKNDLKIEEEIIHEITPDIDYNIQSVNNDDEMNKIILDFADVNNDGICINVADVRKVEMNDRNTAITNRVLGTEMEIDESVFFSYNNNNNDNNNNNNNKNSNNSNNNNNNNHNNNNNNSNNNNNNNNSNHNISLTDNIINHKDENNLKNLKKFINEKTENFSEVSIENKKFKIQSQESVQPDDEKKTEEKTEGKIGKKRKEKKSYKHPSDPVLLGRLLPLPDGTHAHVNCLRWSSEVVERGGKLVNALQAKTR